MSDPTNSPDSPNAISSQVSVASPTPSSLQAGALGLYGPVPALASLSARQVKALGLTISGIYGRRGSISSASAALQSSLASRLQQRLDMRGSTECVPTWKDKTTPSGRPYCQLVPQARRIDATDSGSEPALWITPTTRDWKDSPGMVAARRDGKSRIDQLPRPVAAALWPTPTASLADKGVRSTERAIREAARNHGPDLAAVTVAAALWPTPSSLAPAKDGNNEAVNSAGLVAIRGHAIAGSPDTTEKPGALNPQFVFWLMGFPPAWESCAPPATRSSRKSRLSSSSPMSKPGG